MKELGSTPARLAVCVVAAVAVVYGGEALCNGKNFPLWEKYGKLLTENKLQAVAALAAVLYGASLALWPEEKALPSEEEDFSPCE